MSVSVSIDKYINDNINEYYRVFIFFMEFIGNNILVKYFYIYNIVMSRKKLQKYCNLLQVIKAYDSEFYDALDDLCLLPLFRPGPNGITFAFPDDKSLRKKIIDATYSKTPEVAVKMVKALIFRGWYRKPDDLKGAVQNALNHVVSVKDGKWHGFTIEASKDVEYFDHRNNISIMFLKGKGEIPITGELAPRIDNTKVARSRKTEAVGGGLGCGCMCWPAHRVAICKKMTKYYVHEQDKKSNIFVKKVFCQLRILEKDYNSLYNSSELLMHLGNEEVSDSFLLDMISPDDVMCKLWKIIGQSSSNLGLLSEDIIKEGEYQNQSYFNAYVALKQKRIAAGSSEEDVKRRLQSNIEEQKRLISNVVSVCDLREVLHTSYSNKQQLGRDLFITFTSVMKEMWSHERDMASFENYAYLATHIYTSCKDLVNQEFNQCRDATIYGTLLKCDIFKYIPWTDSAIYTNAGYDGNIFPKPIDLKMFSMNKIVSGITSLKTGGASSILSEYL
jgi:hypothetical protein